ncbi:beta strand repeat-containing protein [Limnohabitans sp. DCL3]|uniref:beta strand repeat-containing protein n=1 Tax=Limnohabitans sp. DCL3 TaxID=3374103 RepID=UPI003A8417E7
MTTVNSTYIFSANATDRRQLDLMNVQLNSALLGFVNQSTTVVGTALVDAVYARAGVSVDFTGSAAGVDTLFLDGYLADYNIAVAGSVLTLSRGASGSTPASTYKLKFDGIPAHDDAVVFADGATTVLALTQSASTPVVLNPAQTSLSAPSILATPASTTESMRVRLDTGSTVIATVTDPLMFIAGSSSVDVVYVNAGSQVDARGLGGSVDQIYLTGNWSDYSKTLVGRAIEFTRTVGGNTERVVVAAGTGLLNDQVFFADGSIYTNTALNAIKLLPNPGAIAALTLTAAGGQEGANAAKTPIATLAKPTITAISNDTAAADFTTSNPSQTITGTYVGSLRAGDKIQVQVGASGNWQDAAVTATSPLGGTFSLAGVTLTTASTVVNARTVGLESNWAASVSGTTNNTNYAGATVTVTLDTDTPTGTLLSAGAGLAADAYANDVETNVSLEISTADLKVGDTVQLQVAGANVGGSFRVTQAHLNAGKLTVSVARSDLVEGPNSVTAVFTDVAGNSSTSQVYALTRDTRVPTIQAAVLSPADAQGVPFTGVANDSYLNRVETTSLIKVSATPGTTGFALGDTVNVYNGATLVGTAVADAAAVNSGDVYVSVRKTDLGADGLKTLSVVASDAAGNTSTAPAPVLVTVDTQIPTPVLRIASTDALGAPLVQDNLMGPSETEVVLVVESSSTGAVFKAGDVVQLVAVTSAAGVTPVTTTALLHANGAPYAPVTIALDGGKAYFNFLKADLPIGNITLQAQINDVAANNAVSGLVTLTTPLTITNAAMVAGNVTALDVHADIVLIASAALDPVGMAGKFITFTNTAVTAGYQAEARVNSFRVDVTDTRFVRFDAAHPERIIVQPPFDFDFGNSYTITIDAGAFQVPGGAFSSLAVTPVDALDFSTVSVTGTSVATANQGQTLNADGTVNAVGKKWINVDGLGDPDAAAVALDLAGADHALVLLDRNAAGALPMVNDGVGALGTHLDVTNWGAGDLIYVDDQANNLAALNQQAKTQVIEGYTASSLQTVWFDASGGTNKQAQININSLEGGGSTLTEAQLLAQINIGNSRYGTAVTVARTDTVSANPALVGNDVDANHPAIITATGLFRLGDQVDLVIYDGAGQVVTLNTPVPPYAVNPTDVNNGFAHIAVPSFAGLSNGQTYYVSTKVTDQDAAVTFSPAISLTYRNSVSAPVLGLGAASNDLTLDMVETGISLHVAGNALSMGDRIELQLGGGTITTGITAGSSTITAGVITVGAYELANGITWTVAKASLPNYQNSVTVKVTDVVNNTANSNPLVVEVPAYVGISGVVGAGPVLAGNDLVAKAYDTSGNLLGEDSSVDAVGGYTLHVRADYTGPLLIEITSQGGANDFMDENTVSATNLDGYTLRAVTTVTADPSLSAGAVAATPITANVTSLTDLAAQKVLGSNAQLMSGLSPAAVTAINAEVSLQFLGVNSDVTTLVPSFTVDTAGQSTASNADRYGQVLKQLSDLAATNGGNINAAQAVVAAQINWSPAAPATPLVLGSGAQQVALLAKVALNADAASPQTGANLLTVQDLSDLGVAHVANLTAPRQAQLIAEIVAGNTATVGSVAALQQLSNQVTSMGRILDLADGVSAPLPTPADYATVGINGVTAINLAAVNSRVAASSSTDLPNVTDVTTVVNAGVTANTAALAKLASFDGTVSVPTVADYVDAGVTGVTAQNLGAVNARLATATPGDSANTSLVQTIATDGAAAHEQAFSLAVNYGIDASVNAAPTVSHLQDLGVVGVSTASLEAVKTLLPQLGLSSTTTPTALTTQITNAVLPSLQPSQAADITPAQMAALSPLQVANLPATVMSSLSPAALKALNADQLTALTGDQVAQLDTTQLNALSPEQLAIVKPPAPVLTLGTGVSDGATAAEAIHSGGAVSVNSKLGSTTLVTFTDSWGGSVSKSIQGNGSVQAVVLSANDLGTGANKLADGVITVTAVATDAAGKPSNVGTTSFNLDTLLPAAPALVLGNGVANGAISAEATDGNGVVTVNAESGASTRVTFTDSQGNSVTKQLTGSGGPQAVILLPGDLGTGPNQLVDGLITVTAVATDAAGNPGSTGQSNFTLDSAAATLSSSNAPVTALTTIAGTAGNSAGETVVLTVTFDGPVNGLTQGTADTTVFLLAGTGGVNATWGGANGSATRTLTYTILAGQNGQVSIDEAALQNVLTANITDVAGNAFTYTANSGTIPNIDTTPLPVVDTTPPAGATGMVFTRVPSGVGDSNTADAVTAVSSGDVVFSYFGSDLANDEKFQYSVNGGNTWSDVPTVDVDSSANTVTVAGLSFTSSPTVQLRAVDAAGNAATLAQQTITYDVLATLSSSNAPSTALTTIAGTAGNSAGETVVLTVTFDGPVNGLTQGTANNTVFQLAGTGGVNATWGGANGSATRTLTYTILAGQNGQVSIDEAALQNVLTANITDVAGNAFTYTANSGTIPNIDTTPLPVVDTTAPVLGPQAASASVTSNVFDGAVPSGSGTARQLVTTFGSSIDDFTMSAWVRLENHGSQAWQSVFGSSNNQYLVHMDGANSNTLVFGRDVYTVAPTFNTWQHFAVTVDSQGVGRFYIDGVQRGTKSGMTVSGLTSLTMGGPSGASSVGANDIYRGLYNQVKIFDRALSASEVVSLADDSTDTAATGLLAYYDAGGMATGSVSAVTNFANSAERAANQVTTSVTSAQLSVISHSGYSGTLLTRLDLQTASDDGSSSSDDITTITTPTVNVLELNGLPFAVGDVIRLVDTSFGNAVLATRTVGSNDLSSGVWNAGTLSMTVGSALSIGVHKLQIQRQDSAGNVSATAGQQLSVDVRAVAPVALDLSGDGQITYTATALDINLDGQTAHSGWVGGQDGLLFWDKFGDGSLRETGQYQFALRAGQTDLQGLAEVFDSNQDGLFSAADASFGDFKAWVDADQNGVSSASELRSLAELGIQSLQLHSDGVPLQPHALVQVQGSATAQLSNGYTMLVHDAMFLTQLMLDASPSHPIIPA